MLAMADRNGRVWGSVPGLANRARVSVDATRNAIDTFLSPDPDSRTPDFEGRRIEVIDGGWRLLNHEKYRAIRDEESTLEAKRKYINARRAEEKAAKKAAALLAVDQSRSHANSVDRSRDNAEADAELNQNLSTPSVSHPSGKPDGQKTPTVPCPYEAIVSAYHELLPTLPKVLLRDGKTWTARQKAMRSLWAWVLSSKRPDGSRRAETADDALSWLRDYFAQASENDFLMGRTGRSGDHANWRCDLDFLLTSRGMKQVIEKTQEQAA